MLSYLQLTRLPTLVQSSYVPLYPVIISTVVRLTSLLVIVIPLCQALVKFTILTPLSIIVAITFISPLLSISLSIIIVSRIVIIQILLYTPLSLLLPRRVRVLKTLSLSIVYSNSSTTLIYFQLSFQSSQLVSLYSSFLEQYLYLLVLQRGSELGLE